MVQISTRKIVLNFQKRPAIAHAYNLEIAEVLAEAGDDINQIEGKNRANLMKIGNQENVSVSKEEYLVQKYRTFGESNPQKCEAAFWYDMVRCNAAAWNAREQFDDKNTFNDQPVWCYERFGKSITAIGGGEFIEIAGRA